jgi:hypothetical protein
MKQTSEGSFSSSTEELGPLGGGLALEGGETLVGVYRNPPPWADESVVFSSDALYVVDGRGVTRVPLRELVGYDSPESKSELSGVRIRTKNSSVFVRVGGSYGPKGMQKDVFSFIMVLRGLLPSEPERR